MLCSCTYLLLKFNVAETPFPYFNFEYFIFFCSITVVLENQSHFVDATSAISSETEYSEISLEILSPWFRIHHFIFLDLSLRNLAKV